MKLFRSLFILIILGLLGTGCWPARLRVTPPAMGLVLDAQTQQPISHAKLVMCQAFKTVDGNYENYSDRVNVSEVLSNAVTHVHYTDDGGHFSMHATHEWVIYYPSGVRLISGMLVVQKDGYQTDIIPVGQLGKDVSKILLQPTGK